MTPEVVLLLTPFKAPRALPAGVKVFDTTREVSYSHKHLTPLFGVATTPLFLQCIEVAPFVQPTGPAVTLSQDPIQLFSLFSPLSS